MRERVARPVDIFGSMWRVEQESVDERTTKLRMSSEGRVLGRAEALRRLRADPAFRDCLGDALREQPHAAFRWETPAWHHASLALPFEFVVVAAPGLAPHPEPEAFAEHYADAHEQIAAFPNSGGDATMIVPCPLPGQGPYNHLAAFLRSAPAGQQHALWRRVGDLLAVMMSDQPLWLSTAGAGVSWLHVRIDRRPKYYAHRPYAVV
jgi:hypothetical protein